jgi:hypothetical protein
MWRFGSANDELVTLFAPRSSEWPKLRLRLSAILDRARENGKAAPVTPAKCQAEGEPVPRADSAL